MKNLIKQLKILTDFPAVSGNECGLAKWLKSYLEPLADKIGIDKVGNVVAIKGKPKITIMAHMDKVGYMVSRVTSNGVAAVPLKKAKAIPPEKATWPVTVLGQVAIGGLLVNTNGGVNLIVDDKNEKLIEVGDLVTLTPNLLVIGENQVISQGLDNTLGLLAGLKIFEQVDNICLVTTVQEEIDQLGARVAAKEIGTGQIIILDVTYDENPWLDYPIEIGKGPVICLKDDLIPNERLAKNILRAAKENKVPYQLEVLESAGSDGKAVLGVDGTKSVVFVGIPIKLMHTPYEMAKLEDVVNTVNLLVKFCHSYA